MFGLFEKKKKEVKSIPRQNENPKVSVIMPVFLGEYEGAAENREEKFKRAVMSFVHQTYENKELIIISDGCDITEKIYNDCLVYNTITFKKIKKQPLFSGKVRAEGVKNATGDIICYLDSDDMLGLNHLKAIATPFSNPELDYVYYNDLLFPPNQDPIPRDVELKHESIGTSTIAHRNYLGLSWDGCDGYGHDWTFIKQFFQHELKGEKIFGAEYYVCHLPNTFDR